MGMEFCRGCGKQVHSEAVSCPHCGIVLRRVPLSSSSDGMEFLLPVGRSGWAIAAGYLALFSVLAFPAPFAIFCGVMGLRDIARNPEKTGKPRAIFGIIMGGGMLVLIISLWITKGLR